MTLEKESSVANGGGRRSRLTPVLLLLFVGSGCAALIYEIVWFQLLQLVIGSSAVSLGVLLGTFMGGMCLGSLFLPRLISAHRNPLLVYAVLEFGIAALGLGVLFLLPLVSKIYVASAAHGFTGILLRGLISGICLLPPTLFMGATLPAIARWIEATPRGISWLGFFYGSNIAGAVFGCLLAGFYLLRVHDMAAATCVAAGINVFVGIAGLILASVSRAERSAVPGTVAGVRSPDQDAPSEREQCAGALGPAPSPEGAGVWPIYVTIALSGLCALGAEVVWTRLLSLLLGGTVYTFSIILAVFLTGLGIGSSGGSVLARNFRRPHLALGVCQLLIAAAMAWTAYMLARSLPFWPIDPSLSRSPWFSFQLDMARVLWAILPATIFWGASFPLALAAARGRDADTGKLVARVYAANTVGAIVGAVGVSMLCIAWLGTHKTQQLLMILAMVSGVISLAPLLGARFRVLSQSDRTAEERTEVSVFDFRVPDSDLREGHATGGESMKQALAAIGLAVAVVVAFILAWTAPEPPWQLTAHGRYVATKSGQETLVYLGEGMNASVAVTESAGGVRNFHVSGKIEASSQAQDMRLQRLLGHLPALLHPKPRSVLIVGCGAGVTAGSFALHPDVERIVICEIEPLIPQVVAEHFADENYHVVRDPRVTIVFDDARHYVLTTREKFDIITSDPIHPWVKGAATLYTKEYFEMCKQRLNPGGLVTQWAPLYESNLDVVKSEVATFFDVFPHGTIWSNDDLGSGYDVVLLGQVEPLRIDLDVMEQRFNRHGRIAQSLDQVGIPSAVSLFATYAGRACDLGGWLARAEINRDRNLRLQYLAGMGSNLYQEAAIYDDLVVHRKFPHDIFAGSEQRRESLRRAIEGAAK